MRCRTLGRRQRRSRFARYPVGPASPLRRWLLFPYGYSTHTNGNTATRRARRVLRHSFVSVWKQTVPSVTVQGMDADKITQATGAEIRAEAAARKIPITRLAEAAGVGRVTLYRYLDATRDMPVAVFLDLSDTLGVRADVLMTRAQERAGGDPEGDSDSN